MLKKYANVVLSIYNEEVDKIFTYNIPEILREKIKIGMRVIVPFGKNNKRYEGYVISICEEIDTNIINLKSILYLPDEIPILEKDMIDMVIWMKDKYYTTISNCIRCVLPKGITIKSNFIYKILNINIDYSNLTKLEQNIYIHIKNKGNTATHEDLLKNFGSNILKYLNLMIEKNILHKYQGCKENKLIKKVKYISLKTKNVDINLLKNEKQKEVVKLLTEKREVSYKYIKDTLNISDSPINTMEKKDIIEIKYIEEKRNTINLDFYKDNDNKILTEEQKNAANFVIKKYENRNTDKKPTLIHGITGSGKTEVYIEIVKKVIKDKKEAIILVPEISLTSQLVERFINIFGDKVTLTHSKLSKGERYDQWRNAKEGKISIMIGPRSAIFTPFKNLGLIILDEEHENTYKSETTPKYDTKEIAYKRSILNNAIVVLGSATPSVETYYKVKNNIIDIVTLKERINKTLPEIKIVDMREELLQGSTSIFSNILKKNIEQNILNKEQTILFLNRRGHSTFISCRKCGYVMKCDQCSVNYAYHIYENKLSCHYCGKKAQKPDVCPVCNSKYIKYFGVGTQKVESEIKKLFPNVKVLRMDLDTTTKKNSFNFILNEFKKGKADILIGTQMIAKGLNFPNVTLVGIIAADISLNTGDYRSSEITFQLITQASGRAGRYQKKGKVFIQTYEPNHYSIIHSKNNDYENFYNNEISLRRQLFYPPYSNIFVILFSGTKEKEIISLMFKLSYIMNYYNKKNDFSILGPSPAHVSKIKNNYRWKIIIKNKDEERIKKFAIYCVEKLKKLENTCNINISLNLNPIVNI